MAEVSIRGRATWLAHLFKAMAYQYHRPLADQVKGLIPADGVVMDVGAHSGQHSKLFARMVPRGTVYAFEPGSYASSILRPTIKAHRLGNVKIVPLGLSDHPSVETLHVPLKRRGSVGFGLSHLGADGGTRETIVEEVRLTTLDIFAAKEAIRRVDFIKVDIEGWEVNFLKGAEKTISTFRPTILIEVKADNLVRAGAIPGDVFDFLAPYSYRIFKTSEARDYDMVPVDGFTGGGDYLFVPDDRAALIKAA